MKCTERITGHGSGSTAQRAPPSDVASSTLVPTAQPTLLLMKSTEVNGNRPRYCTVQFRPPSAVARIVSRLTAQPREAETNWIPAAKPGIAGTAGQPGLAAAALAPTGLATAGLATAGLADGATALLHPAAATTPHANTSNRTRMT
jgi:hypothetical protein